MPFLTDILQGLIDGTQPLPPPHPQKLNFTTDPEAMRQVALCVERLALLHGLSETDERHLTFKLAWWCTRRGLIAPPRIRIELLKIHPSLAMALTSSPTWLTSRAGVPWALRRYEQWRNECQKGARQSSPDPLPVAEIAPHGFYLVELTNAAHVYAEGVALGHCMASAYNAEALKKLGANFTEQKALDCLAYAVKLRHGELRIFSARDLAHQPVLTIAYHPKRAWLVRMEGRPASGPQPWEWSRFRCDATRALATVVPIKRVFPEVLCRVDCAGAGWCRTAFASGEPSTKALVAAFPSMRAP